MAFRLGPVPSVAVPSESDSFLRRARRVVGFTVPPVWTRTRGLWPGVSSSESSDGSRRRVRSANNVRCGPRVRFRRMTVGYRGGTPSVVEASVFGIASAVPVRRRAVFTVSVFLTRGGSTSTLSVST